MSVPSYDAVVIGGGISGAAILHHLVRRGLRRCVLIERGGVASGPTGVSSAIVRTHYQNETYARMALEGLRFFQRSGELNGGSASFRATGYLLLAPEADVPQLSSTVAMHQRQGIRTSFVGPEEIRELEPAASLEGVGGGAFEPESGHADPVGTAHALVAAAVDGGAVVWRNTPVTRVLVDDGVVTGVSAGGDRTVRSERVVIAAGPWSRELARAAGTDVPTLPVRHPVAVLESGGGRRPSRVVADISGQIYVRPEGTDLLLAGGLAGAPIGAPADPDAFDARTSVAEAAFFAERVLRRFPSLDASRGRRGWAGIYDMSPDRAPIIDELPTARGCFVVCGTSGHGFKLAPAIGALVADLVLGATPAYDPAMFRLARFESGPGKGPPGADRALAAARSAS